MSLSVPSAAVRVPLPMAPEAMTAIDEGDGAPYVDPELGPPAYANTDVLGGGAPAMGAVMIAPRRPPLPAPPMLFCPPSHHHPQQMPPKDTGGPKGPGQVGQEPRANVVYTVKPGDTLTKIAARFDVTWQDVYAANKQKIEDPDLIHPGQRFVIPTPDVRSADGPGTSPKSPAGPCTPSDASAPPPFAQPAPPPFVRMPPVQSPPKQSPPTQGPPTQGPPTQGPPIQAPPFQGPPTQVPPFQGPPMQGPPTQGPPVQGPPPVIN